MIILKILGWVLLALLILLCVILLLLFIALIIPANVRIKYEDKSFWVGLKILFFKKQLYPPVPKPEKSKKNSAEIKKKKAQAKKKKAVNTKNAAANKTDTGEKEKAKLVKKTVTEEKTVQPPEITHKIKTETKAENKNVKSAKEKIQKGDKSLTVKVKSEDTQVEADLQAEASGGALISNEFIKIGLEDISDIVYAATGLIKRILKSLKFKDIVIVLPIYDEDPSKCAVKYGKVNAFLYAVTARLENTLRLYFKRVDIYPDFENKRADEQAAAVTVRGTLMGLLVAVLWAANSLKKDKILFPNGIHLFKK